MQSNVLTAGNKDKYKLKNWSEYNNSLCRRGSITLWLEDAVLTAWEAITPEHKVVGMQTYPDCVILCCQVLRMQYHQCLRQATGFIASLLALMGKDHWSVPDYSTLCRRQGGLPVTLTSRREQGQNIEIAIDSTGLKVYGEGEWKVRKHGTSKRRTWRKLHIGIDVDTQEIISVLLTTNAEDDGSAAVQMIKGKTGQLKSFRGDGAYDDFKLREALGEEVVQIIPPPKDAVVHKGTAKKPLAGYLKQRNEAVGMIKEKGTKAWKEHSGYHRRSLNEVAMYRYKTIFGSSLNARKTDNEETEVKIKCALLNRYRALGMPLSYKAA